MFMWLIFWQFDSVSAMAAFISQIKITGNTENSLYDIIWSTPNISHMLSTDISPIEEPNILKTHEYTVLCRGTQQN